jgi:hypothetical protein
MSDYRLNTSVHAVELDANGALTGREAVFGPDSDINAPENEWALAAITNPDVWEGEAPPKQDPPAAAESGEVAALKARIAQLEAEKAGREEDKAPDPEPVVEQPDPKATPRKATGTK